MADRQKEFLKGEPADEKRKKKMKIVEPCLEPLNFIRIQNW